MSAWDLPSSAPTCARPTTAKSRPSADSTLEIQAGECFGLLGPNGAGKTTTIEILEGLLQPTSGEVEIFGHSWDDNPRQLRELLGISLQETRLAEKLTRARNHRLFASFYRYPRPAAEAIDELRSRRKRMPGWASSPADRSSGWPWPTALVGNPRILFLDEPTTGLDPQSRRQLWDIVRRFQRKGGTVLLTTHYMDEAERLCDRLAIVDHGRDHRRGNSDRADRAAGWTSRGRVRQPTRRRH